MNLNVGSILNSAMTIGSAISEGTNDSGKASLKDFLYTMSTYGVAIKSNFEVVYDGIVGLQFFIQNISTPGIKTNNGQIYYKGRVVDVPVNYEQEHEFSMTVINDATGFIYQSLRKILINDYNNRELASQYKMTIRAMGDQNNFHGQVITMNGVRITSVSGLDFGHTDNNVQTFTVNCIVQMMQIQQTQFKHTEGILDKIDNITNTVNSFVSNVFGV